MTENTPPQSDAAILAELEASLKSADADGTTSIEPVVATVQLHLEGKTHEVSMLLAPGFPYRYTEEEAMIAYVAALVGRAAMAMFFAHYDLPMPGVTNPVEDEP